MGAAATPGTMGDLLVLLPAALACGYLVLRVIGDRIPGLLSRNALLLLAMALSLVPLGDASTARFLYAVIGDLSIPSVLLLGLAVGARVVQRPLLPAAERRWLSAIFGGGALLLYPMALGLTGFDPYALGYHPVWLGNAVLLLALAALLQARYLVATLLIAACMAFSFQILESTNLWDYLLDPCLAVYTLSVGTRLRLRVAFSFATTHARKEPSP